MVNITSDKSNLSSDKRKSIVTICKAYGIQEVNIFGSILSKDFSQINDLDILINLPKNFGMLDLIRLKEELEVNLQISVDLVTKNGIHPKIYNLIKEDMVTIYS